MGSGADGLDREAAREAARPVGLVELLRRDLGRWPLVHPQQLGESPRDLRRPLHHQVAADLVVVVAKPVREPRARGMQQQPRRLDGVPADRDGGSALEPHAPVVDERHPRTGPAVVDLEADGHRVGADLGAVLDRVGDMGDERAGLRVHLAALEAESAVDAVGPVAEDAVCDRHRADAHLDAVLQSARPRPLGGAAHRMRCVRVAVRIAPGPLLARHRQLAFDALVVRLQIRIGDRPVGPDAVRRRDREVGRVEARRVAGVVHHRAADAVTRVVLPHLDRVVSADDPLVVPVEVRRTLLVGDPVGVGIPERPPLEHDDAPSGAGEPLGENAATRATADDHDVHLVVVPVAVHPVVPGHAPPMRIQQPRGVVADRADGAFQQRGDAHSSPRRLTSGTGSTSSASRPSHASSRPTPMRAYPRGYAGPPNPISFHAHGWE